ncbi:unnamed protein product, partial [Polarella glacialis]
DSAKVEEAQKKEVKEGQQQQQSPSEPKEQKQNQKQGDEPKQKQQQQQQQDQQQQQQARQQQQQQQEQQHQQQQQQQQQPQQKQKQEEQQKQEEKQKKQKNKQKPSDDEQKPQQEQQKQGEQKQKQEPKKEQKAEQETLQKKDVEMPKDEEEADGQTNAAVAKSKARRGKPKSKDDRGFPILPPSDYKVQGLISEGTSLFESDPEKATVLLRLAGRKGYVPAYLLLAQLASQRNNDALMIETLCGLLATPEAEKQMPEKLLSNCAFQLAAALRDPRNKPEGQKHEKELGTIAKRWPIVGSVCEASNSFEDVQKRLREKQQELLKLS